MHIEDSNCNKTHRERLRRLALSDLGWNSFFESEFWGLRRPSLVPARVIEELKGSHRLRTEQGDYLAEVAGRVRYQAEDRDDLPAVGDWVGITPRPEEGRARIECILPRRTKLSRKVAGREQSEQIIATNLDTVFVVGSLNREFNVRRIERYLTLVYESGARPVVLLNKADLCLDSSSVVGTVESIALGTPRAPPERVASNRTRSRACIFGTGANLGIRGFVWRWEVHDH